MRRFLVVLLVSCGGLVPSTSVTPTVSSQLPTGAEVAVVELGDAAYAFDRGSVNIVRGTKIVAHVDAPGSPWQDAATITSPDGEGRWVVGLAGGTLWRVTPLGGLERASERLGIAGATVLSIDSAGTTAIIGFVGGELVTTGASHVMRFTGPDARVVAASRDRVAIGTASAIDVFDLAKNSKVSYPLASPSYLGFRNATTDHASLIAATGDRVYEERQGKLAAAKVPDTTHLAISGSRLWLLSDGRVYAEDDRGLVAVAAPHGTRIFGSRTGGVWVAEAATRATRYTLDAPGDDPVWHRVVEPVFRHVCASCHLPGGDADLDLSTPASWSFRRSEITLRVLVARTMPPAGTEITEADRQALATWLNQAP